MGYMDKIAASPFFTPKEGGVAEVIRPLNDGPFVAEVWRTPPEGKDIHPGQIRKILPTTVNQEKTAMSTRKQAATSFVKAAMPMGTGGAGQYMAKGGVVKGKDDEKGKKGGYYMDKMKGKGKDEPKGKEKDEKKGKKKTEETGKTKDMGKRLAGRKGYMARMKKKDD